MAKEQIIYVGPEEELTNVRERLEHIQTGHIVLVIPPQTQLRSHVGWRLLRSRVRELGQDVLVISSDRQVRAVAKAAGFRVAESLESPPSDRPRPSNRPVRSAAGARTSQGSSKQAGGSRRDSRYIRPGQQPDKRNLPANGRQQAPLRPGGKGRAVISSGEMNTGSGAASSTYEIQDLPFDSHYAIPGETVPPGPSVAGREDDEIDSLVADYYVARSIREAAQGTEAEAKPSSSEVARPSSGKLEQSSKIPPQSRLEDDPFSYMEDVQPVSLPEQRASAFIHDIDPGIPDIADIPTDVHEVEIEDLGDEGEVMLQPDMPPGALAEPVQETPRIYSMPQRDNRLGSSSRPSFEDIEDEDELLPVPIQDQPTRVTPATTARSSGPTAPPAGGKREPQPILQSAQQARNVQAKPSVQQAKKPASVKAHRTVTKPPMSGRTGAISQHRGRRITALAVIGLAVLLLAVLAFLYFGSNATVTIVVPSQSLSATGQYVASTNQHNTRQNTIPSQVLTYSASASGQGTATGTVRQGNQVATGTVTFSNTGSQPLDIPTGTVLSTIGAVATQFVTVADALVQPDTSSGIPSVVPVQAQLPGDSGNVAANSITIIPPDSIIKIAQKNSIPSTSVNLKVTNPDPTTGGGASSVTAVSANDVSTLALVLHRQAQNEIKLWLAKSVLKGDVAGTLMPDVLGSSTPLPGEKVITTPTVGQPAPGGKFTGVLSVSVSILVIRNAAIQNAARDQLNASAGHMNPPFALTTHSPAVKVTKSSPSKDGTTLTITVNATGQIIPRISTQELSKQLAGKSVDSANSYIMKGQAGIKEVVSTSIDSFPAFLSLMPFRPEQIHIIVQPGPGKNNPAG